MEQFQVGDKVRVTKVTTLESLKGVKIGNIFTLTDRSWTPRNPDVLFLKRVDGCPIVLEVEQVELIYRGNNND